MAGRSRRQSAIARVRIDGDAKPRTGCAAFAQGAEKRLVAIGRLDEDLRLALAARALLERSDAARPLARLARQVTAEREALAFEPRGHERERDRARPDERHDAEACRVRRFHERRAWIGDRRAAGLGEQAERPAFA